MDGILPIYKEANMTSHDVIHQLRKLLKIKKIGHSGTLDPNATGVLLVLVGRATKILPFLEDTDKEYIATLGLGAKTSTDDQDGEIINTSNVLPIVDFDNLLKTFLGKQKQIPPMISSVKVKGKKLYEYARQNIEIDRPIRDIEIYDIEMLNQDLYEFRVACSSGTYVRSLCVDIAEKSGNLGYMKSLIRTKVGRFSINDCYTLNDISENHFKIYSIADALMHIPVVEYQNKFDIVNGKKIYLNTLYNRVLISVDKEILAIYEKETDHCFRCLRGLW